MATRFVDVSESQIEQFCYIFSNNHQCNFIKTIIHLRLCEHRNSHLDFVSDIHVAFVDLLLNSGHPNPWLKASNGLYCFFLPTLWDAKTSCKIPAKKLLQFVLLHFAPESCYVPGCYILRRNSQDSPRCN